MIISSSHLNASNGQAGPDTGQHMKPVEPANAKQARSESSKKRLQILFSLCKENQYERAAEYIIYGGDDHRRQYNDFLDFRNYRERWRTVSMCRHIQLLLHSSTKIEFVSYFEERESEGVWHIWLVRFPRTEGKAPTAYFAMLKIASQYGLGEIEDASEEP